MLKRNGTGSICDDREFIVRIYRKFIITQSGDSIIFSLTSEIPISVRCSVFLYLTIQFRLAAGDNGEYGKYEEKFISLGSTVFQFVFQ